MSPWARRALRSERWSAALAGIGLGLVLSFIGNQMTAGTAPFIAGGAFLAWVVALLLRRLNPPVIDLITRTPLSLHSDTECDENARRAYIGFVPLYTPQPGTEASKLSPNERAEAVETLAFDRLDINLSNLAPTITAIRCHKKNLEHCWLLPTADRSGHGSQPYAYLLAEYLRQREGLTCTFHYGSEYVISLDQDALVFDKTYRRVRAVIGEAMKLGIAPRQMVADITTGVRSMTMGMVLACLDRDQDVEVVGTRYDDRGRPTGDLFPLIFRFEPDLKDRET